MPISYKINPTTQRVFTYVTGPISTVDIVGHFEVARREGFLPYSELIDASSIDRPTLSVTDLWTTAMALRKLKSQGIFGSRAVWVANDTIYVLTQMFASLMAGYIRMGVFHDRITAEEWLNQKSGGKKTPPG
jgi:hypothetical protein